MRGDNCLINISLTKRPNGRKMKFAKPMRIKRGDADRLVDAGRANFISKTQYRQMVSAIPKPKAKAKSEKGSKKKKMKR